MTLVWDNWLDKPIPRDESSLRAAVAQHPNNPEFRFKLADLLLSEDRNLEALAEYKEVLTLRPEWTDPWTNLAFCLMELGRYDEAIVEYRRILFTDPDCHTAHYHLGWSLREKQQFDEAIIEFYKAASLDSHNYASYYNIAYIHSSLENIVQAISFLEKALERASWIKEDISKEEVFSVLRNHWRYQQLMGD